MSTTAEQPVTVPIQHRRKSRALPVTAGAVLATIGSVVALAGGGVLAVAGDDGTVGSGGDHHVSTATSALVTGTATIEDTRDVASALGQPKVGVKATSSDDGRDVFVGIGRTADVDRYLGDASIDRVTDVRVAPFKLEKHSEGAATKTPKPPASQNFWVAKSSGHSAKVDWKVKDGDYRVVVMNADGSLGVAADSHFEVGIPYLSTLGLTGMLVGVVMLGGGVVLIARGASRSGHSTPTVVPPPMPQAQSVA